ncbi:MAG: 50S ribosomal protein L18a [Candidatus Diapherotrites archaeon]|nr:50S ribosomal protein L18a [Candidatus Diapherotrites archaeon]
MADEKVFEAKGIIVEKGVEKPFTKRVGAANEKFAKEKILSAFGSRHRLKRRMVKITSIAVAKEKAKRQ